jgi:enterochelin esterase-like enzyme
MAEAREWAIGGITSAGQQPNPERHENGEVTFHLKAPNAKGVQVVPLGGDNGMGDGPFEMTRGDEGEWTVRLRPARPGFHYYLFSVDGCECLSPYAEVFYGWGRVCHGLEVPGGNDPGRALDVSHGDVCLHWYPSPITGRLRRATVYTPPSYATDLDRRYPVLHLQHGSGESDRGWTWQGKTNFVLDNLLAEGACEEMIVVMDNGYATPAGVEADPHPRGGDNVFEDVLLGEQIPDIGRRFRTLDGCGNRALAGLSMGAGQAMRIGFKHLDTFGWIGAFSGGGRGFDPATSFDGVFADPKAIDSRLRLLWMGCGRLDGGYESAKTMHETLDASGIAHGWLETEGAHEWRDWQFHLQAFAQRLFR